ncbi:MarR family transcriptional regulator [Arthrobacter sp. Y-9]|uniref:MarR family winged helix-turn-helix transcriptional regulator n=1 Tax=Arthrobacter sp. Y-9 TaxID=3039385 RepID=UPI00241DE76A|nr:MarR family transcriptional regulator [Arthrobacter sp. Y-9]WFR83253.1 MarR family transcriptional regulator [Arthrobacter sp. Y-9]
MTFPGDEEGLGPASMYHAETADPHEELVDRSGVSPEDLQQINRVMEALAALRTAENELSDASRRYMKLNESDMRALHYLIVARNQGIVATPGGIATHLGISTASTTKLLDRLERAGHVLRQAHPSDRRALAITVTEETRAAAMNTVGRQQARRFGVAAGLAPAEREVVIRFLQEMAREITPSPEIWESATAE